MTYLSESPWPDVARAAGDGGVLVVPLGSTEQHGPHLPLTTDGDIAQAVVDRAAQRDHRVVAAPLLAYGSSGEHQGFAGTLSLGQEATEHLLVELVRSAAAFAHVVLASAHGGNAGPLGRAVERLVAEGRSVIAWSPRWGGDLHAGRTETSLMLAIAPDRVHEERAQAGNRSPAVDLVPLLVRDGVAAHAPNGVLGDPAGASAEEGRALLERAVDDLLSVVTSCSVLTEVRP